MNICPNCEQGELELSHIDIASGWVSIVIVCDICNTQYSGDLQVEHMDKVEDCDDSQTIQG